MQLQSTLSHGSPLSVPPVSGTPRSCKRFPCAVLLQAAIATGVISFFASAPALRVAAPQPDANFTAAIVLSP